MQLRASILTLLASAAWLAGCNDSSSPAPTPTPTPTPATPTPTPTTTAGTRTIIFVWDGLRPDDVSLANTPNLYTMRNNGTEFSDNHSTYPTFTMMNGSSFATGSFPKTSGFYGNTFWAPPRPGNVIPSGIGAGGAPADYQDPIFTEDYQVLNTLNNYYGGQLLLVKTLFKTAQEKGLTTATVGKSGAAFIQDLARGGYFLDENTAEPRSLVTELQAANIPVPLNTTIDYSATASPVTLAANNGNPTARAGYITFNTTAYDPNGQLTVAARDSSDTSQGAPEDAANKYMMSVYTGYILPKKLPMLSLIWFRTPDNVEHGYGPGTANEIAGLKSQDARLGELLAALKANNLDKTTNVIVVSDHGHSTVSGPTALYPLRAITAATTPPNGAPVNGSTSGTDNAQVGAPSVGGYSFSGDVRSADLLWYRGFKAYDGAGCSTSAMYGLSLTGTPTVPVRSDAAGTLCGTANAKYQAVSSTLAAPVASFKVPAPGALPANGIVVAANGGSDYFYVPSHDQATVQNLVRTLQAREEYGAIFVDSRYGDIPGTLKLSTVNLENATRKGDGQPDVVVSFDWDDKVTVQGKNGIEFESVGGQRGMHGSFGPTDVHNTLIGFGPSFKPGFVDTLPTGNVDVAPTVAYVLGLSMTGIDGRILNEGLVTPASAATGTVTSLILSPTVSASGLLFELPVDLTGATKDTGKTGGTYTIQLGIKDFSVGGTTYRYFDYAKAVRS